MLDWKLVEKDGLPEIGKPILVAGQDSDNSYPSKFIHVAKLEEINNTLKWRYIYDADLENINQSDKWTYFNTPQREEYMPGKMPKNQIIRKDYTQMLLYSWGMTDGQIPEPDYTGLVTSIAMVFLVPLSIIWQIVLFSIISN